MNNLKKIFFTSDWHLFHHNSIGFDNRPFKDTYHMHRVLINNYNATVQQDGICFFLGDMGLSKNTSIKSVVSELNGTKVFILGNHDKGTNAMYNSGFDAVLSSASMYIASHKVTMSHCPLQGVYRENTLGMRGTDPDNLENWHGERKNHQFTVTDEGQFHLHGHVHSPNQGKSKKILGKQYDVGVVANNYTPVNISVIESWIAKYNKNLVKIITKKVIKENHELLKNLSKGIKP